MSENRMWDWVYKSFYEAYFQELTAEAIAKRWYGLDLFTSLLVTASASGSAVAGWSLWSQPGWKEIWIFVASVAATGSILHTVINVTGRLKKQQKIRQVFSSLRVRFQTLLAQIDIGLDGSQANARFQALQNEMEESVKEFDPDLLNTKRLRDRVEQDVRKKADVFFNEELSHAV